MQSDNRSSNQHKLELSYQQYVKQNRSIANCRIDKYLIFQKVGDGSLGDVYRGMNVQTRKQVSVKLIDIRKYRNNLNQAYIKKSTKNQIENLNRLNSEHIVKLYDVYINADFRMLVMEYCNGPTLTKYIQDRKQQRIPTDQAIEILKQLIIGLSFMHQQKMIHRDLKTDNIMFHCGVIKILDLGFSKVMKKTGIYQQTIVGTPISMAPEVINKQKYGLKADIWSLGVVFYTMIYGTIPFQPKPIFAMYQYITTTNIFPNQGKINNYRAPKQIQNLIKSMLQPNQQRRIDWYGLSNNKLLFNNRLPANYTNLSSLQYTNYTQAHDNIVIDSDDHDNYNNNQIQIFDQNSSQLTKLSNQQINKHQYSIDHTQLNQYNILSQYYLDCKKTQLIIYKIIIPIQQTKAFNLTDRKVIEMLYLFCTRCYCNLAFLKWDIKNLSKTKINKLQVQINKLNTIVNEKFYEYSKKLSAIENQFINYISDGFLKLCQRGVRETKDKFLVGVEICEEPTIVCGVKQSMRQQRYSSDRQIAYTEQPTQSDISDNSPDNKTKSQKQILSPISPFAKKSQNSHISTSSQKQSEKKAGFIRSEQISYTQTSYININLYRLNKQEHKQLHLYLQNYEKINRIQRKDLGNQTFDDLVCRIIGIRQQ